MSDIITLKEIPSLGSDIPRELAWSDPAYIKHVICEGARFHVVTYTDQGNRCSEPSCIVNKPASAPSPEPPSAHNREGTGTEKWEAKKFDGGYYGLFVHGKSLVSGLTQWQVESLINAHNESLARLQQPKEQGLEEKSLGGKDALSDHNAPRTDGALRLETQYESTSDAHYICDARSGEPITDYGFERQRYALEFCDALNRLLSENGGQPSSATGVSSPTPSPSCENCLLWDGNTLEEAVGKVGDGPTWPEVWQKLRDLHNETITALQQQLQEHLKHVGEFLSELYATMIDPLADGELNVKEVCETLLKQARKDREQLQKKDREQKDMLDRWEELQRALRLGPDDDYFAGPLRKANNTIEVARWAQAVLTAWNTGDLQKDSPLHKKLREVMIAYRSPALENKTADVSAEPPVGRKPEWGDKDFLRSLIGGHGKREPAVTATPTPKQDGSLPCPALPVPNGLDFRNAGHKCDQLFGPCACGAWHTFDDLAFRIFNQLKTRADHAPSIDGEQGK